MPRKYRPHQCPNCENMVEASSGYERFKGLCKGGRGTYYPNFVWLEVESNRNCQHFTVKANKTDE